MLPMFYRILLSMVALVFFQASVLGSLVSPEVGSQAVLSTESHDVSGVVTILDEDTVRIDNFTYDGGGGAVYFYLGTVNTEAAFEVGLRIEPLLSGMIFDGTEGPLLVDLPIGETLEDFHGFSVWCEARAVNFGSGTFLPVAVPEPASLVLISFGTFCLLIRRRR